MTRQTQSETELTVISSDLNRILQLAYDLTGSDLQQRQEQRQQYPEEVTPEYGRNRALLRSRSALSPGDRAVYDRVNGLAYCGAWSTDLPGWVEWANTYWHTDLRLID